MDGVSEQIKQNEVQTERQAIKNSDGVYEGRFRYKVSLRNRRI